MILNEKLKNLNNMSFEKCRDAYNFPSHGLNQRLLIVILSELTSMYIVSKVAILPNYHGVKLCF